jgi:hypothetical protein
MLFFALDGPDPEGATRDSPVGYEVAAVDNCEPSAEDAVDSRERDRYLPREGCSSAAALQLPLLCEEDDAGTFEFLSMKLGWAGPHDRYIRAAGTKWASMRVKYFASSVEGAAPDEDEEDPSFSQLDLE